MRRKKPEETPTEAHVPELEPKWPRMVINFLPTGERVDASLSFTASAYDHAGRWIYAQAASPELAAAALGRAIEMRRQWNGETHYVLTEDGRLKAAE